MNQPITQRVIELCCEVLGRDTGEVALNSRFVEDLEANSLDVVQLACLIEDDFGIRIPESRIFNIRTISDVVDAISELKQD